MKNATKNDVKVYIYNAMMISQHVSGMLAGLVDGICQDETDHTEQQLISHLQTFILATNQLIDTWNEYAVQHPVLFEEEEEEEFILTSESLDDAPGNLFNLVHNEEDD